TSESTCPVADTSRNDPTPFPAVTHTMIGRASVSTVLLLTLCRVVDPATAQTAVLPGPMPGEAAPAILSVEVRPSLEVLAPTPAAFSDAAPEEAVAPTAASTSAYGLSGALRVALVASGRPVPTSLLPTLAPEVERPRWIPIHGTVRSGLPGEPVYHGDLVAPENP